MKDLKLFYELNKTLDHQIFQKYLQLFTFCKQFHSPASPPSFLPLHPENFVPNKQDLISPAAAAHTGYTSHL